ncbi:MULTISPECIES: dihydrofolate reductase family protein [unclassified Microcoleus]|uniref:dihydrofolate reductase family protein n=1 Tax=unclassified Microcoleus TaxID=2642155 RepID=UPI002FD18277
MTGPHATVILAISADGKIADAVRSPARFGSANDKAHLEQQVAASDAVLFGNGTLQAYGTTMRVISPELVKQRELQGKPPQPVQIVCSRSIEFDPNLRFFQQPVPRWLLTGQDSRETALPSPSPTKDGETALPSPYPMKNSRETALPSPSPTKDGETALPSPYPMKDSRETALPSPSPTKDGETALPSPYPMKDGETALPSPYPMKDSKFDRTVYAKTAGGEIDWIDAFQQLASFGLKRLAILGGGKLVASVLAAGLVDELWLTVCPLILGGADAPTPVEGKGFLGDLAPKLELLAVKQVGQEVFLHYRIDRFNSLPGSA